MTDPKTSPCLLRAADIAAKAEPHAHPKNPNSSLIGTRLGAAVGFKRLGINHAKIPPGKESFLEHAHHNEEEWLYILSGRGIARIDGQDYEVGPGDFMGFPTPSVPHHLRNPFDTELEYLMGGEVREIDIVDFPGLGLRATISAAGATLHELAAARPLDWHTPPDGDSDRS